MQNLGQSPGAATSGSVGVAEIDDVKAVKTARAVTKAKRILSEDVIWDQKLREMSNFYMLIRWVRNGLTCHSGTCR